MRRVTLALIVLLGSCEYSPVNPDAGQVRLSVTASGFTANVAWSVDSRSGGGQNVAIPWELSSPASSGQVVSLSACNTYLLGCFPQGGLCPVTVIATIYWEGRVLAKQTNTGLPSGFCGPGATVTATIP